MSAAVLAAELEALTARLGARLPAIALLLLASTAHADDAADRARAVRLLDRGAKLVRASDPACLDPLTVVSGLDASGPVLGELGLCEEVAGKRAAAYERIGRVLDKMPAGVAAREPWRRFVEAQRRLERRVARAVLSVSPQEAEVWLDGRALGARSSGRIVALDPGEHVWTARAAGYVTDTVKHTVAAGDLPPVRIELKASAPAVVPSDLGKLAPLRPFSAPPSPLVPSLSPRGVAVGVTYAAGAVALVSGIVAGVLEAQRSALRSGLAADACPTAAPERCAQLRLVFEQRTDARNVALVAAGVAVAAGGVAVGLHFSGVSVAKGSASVMVVGQW